MRVKIFMATLAATLMLGVQGFANPCACVDPCGATCDRFAVRGGDLFSGLKRLVSGVRIVANHCDPCDPVVACNPCDEVACNPCDEVCAPRLGFGGRLRNLLAAPSLCSPCDGAGDPFCNPCDFVRDCDPCGEVNGCNTSRFSLRGLNPFRNFRLNSGCFTDCSPCDAICSPCDAACGPCDGAGDVSCGPRGHLLDLPRFNLSRLFNGLRVARCNAADCGPCDGVQPCNGVCCR